MKLIRLLTTLAGPEGCVPAGKCCQCDDKRAKLLIDSFSAEEVKKEDVKNDFIKVHLKDVVPLVHAPVKTNESDKKPS